MKGNLVVCFSGGGFRATLFHLGVVNALRNLELLTRVVHIYSVSGGSILAAHLILNWEKYSVSRYEDDRFREVASELIDFIRLDLRGRLVRRWVLLGWIPRYRRINQLQHHYSRLYHGAVLENTEATGRPRLSILATSMISGDVCAFTAKGLRRNCTSEPREVVAPEIAVAKAVAASSAFPPLFPPVIFRPKEVGATRGELIGGEILTDGGSSTIWASG